MLLSTTGVGADLINIFNKGVIKAFLLPVWTPAAPLRCISARWESKFSCRLLPATYKLIECNSPRCERDHINNLIIFQDIPPFHTLHITPRHVTLSHTPA